MTAARASLRAATARTLLLQGAWYHGVNAHPRNYATSLQTTMVASAVANGVKTVRIDVDWGQYETPSKGTYSGTQQGNVDFFMAAAATAGLDVLVVVTGTPLWANGSNPETTPPTSNADYTDFLAYLIGRYASIKYIEVWNEPDLTNSWMPTSAANYVALLAASYARVKGINAAIKIIAPALSNYASGTYLTAFYAAGGKASCDVMSFHLYSDPPNHGNGSIVPEQLVVLWVNAIFPILASNGDASKEIWVTECGWNTHTADGVTQTVQANYVPRLFAAIRLMIPNCTRLYLYEFMDDTDTSPTANQSYGLTHNDVSSKLALAAYAGMP